MKPIGLYCRVSTVTMTTDSWEAAATAGPIYELYISVDVNDLPQMSMLMMGISVEG